MVIGDWNVTRTTDQAEGGSRKRRPGFFALAFCLVFIPSCTKRQAPPSIKTAFIVISGDTAGWITPCGCTANQSGGLLRRGSYLASVRKDADVLYVDCGGAVGGNSPYQRAKLDAILRGEELMSVAAHNVGKAEAAFGVEYLKSSAAPFISANATDAAGREIVRPGIIATIGGRRIAFVGVLSPEYATADVHVTDPKRAILNYVQNNKANYDSLIVLAYLPTDELSALAGALPEADAVIGGPTGQAIEPHAVGPTLLAAATNKGKFLVELKIPPARDPWSGRVVELNARWPDDSRQLDNLHQFLGELRRRDFRASETGFAPPLPPGAPVNYRVAGSASCAKCHAAEDAAWHASHHANAWDTLKPRGFDVDPACLVCHTTGYGQPGGFDSVSRSAPALAGVGCESCHGPSQAHVLDPKVHTTFHAVDQCVRCHDAENSPAFNFETYWAKIRHGSTNGSRQ